MNITYNFKIIEEKWKTIWKKEKSHSVDLGKAKKPFYNLMMFPYPSAEGLHIGNVYAYIGSDIQGRFMKAHGYDVFEPIGFDAFGIHSENYALKKNQNPWDIIPQNIKGFTHQLKRIGAMFDWSNCVNTTDPSYYKWTQWIFLTLFKNGLAYQKDAPVNYCPACKTVLADEQAEDGFCERCRHAVEMKHMRQWFFKITAYAERLLCNLDWIDWPEITKKAQKHWIGRNEEKRCGKKKVVYHLHDWCISRQRYWGPPIPVVYCDDCGVQPVDEKDLPVLLPYIEDFKPDGSGKSPLAKNEDFVHTCCPQCKGPAKRETDVSDNFLDSAWYFLRYPNSQNDHQAFDKEITEKWLPVDMYIGGNEHAVLHLMYTRFLTMVFHDIGLISFEEPFKKFRANGMIIRDGEKMSKTKGNVIKPDVYIKEYGTDVFRTYLMFFGNFKEGGNFRDRGIPGIQRFIERLWQYCLREEFSQEEIPDKDLLVLLNTKIKQVTGDIIKLDYNTAIAGIMELLNGLMKREKHYRKAIQIVLKLLSPFAPFITHELWQRLGEDSIISIHPWPEYDPDYIQGDIITFVIQINGKVRDTVELPVNADQEKAREEALKCLKIQKYLHKKRIVKEIFVKNKLMNLVVESLLY